MTIIIVTASCWGIGMTAYVIYKCTSSSTTKKDKIVFFNVTDRVVKNKKFKDVINNKAKGSYNVK